MALLCDAPLQIPRATDTSLVWKPPCEGHVKMNIDAAVGEGGVGLGMVVRDSIDNIIMSVGRAVKSGMTVAHAEAAAVLFGLKYAYDAGFRTIEVELVSLLQDKSKENSGCKWW